MISIIHHCNVYISQSFNMSIVYFISVIVSLSRLDCSEYSVLFSCGKLSLNFNSINVDFGNLCDGLYKIALNHEFAQSLVTLHSNVGSKRSKINKNTSTL